MLKRVAAARAKSSSSSSSTTTTAIKNATTQKQTSPQSVFHNTDITTLSSNNNNNITPSDEVIERIRLKIPNAHVFKLPPKPTAGGWRGAEWHDKVWQGTLKVVERGDETAVLLVDSNEERNIFAVCPILHNINQPTGGGGDNNSNSNTTLGAQPPQWNANNGIDRCIDSSRYFVLRIQNAQGRTLYIGLAFNERNDAFDFNTALEDSRREKYMEKQAELGIIGSMLSKQVHGDGDGYKMKEGEKIRVSIPNNKNNMLLNNSSSSSSSSEEDWDKNNSSPEKKKMSSVSVAAARRREAKKNNKANTTASSSGGFGGFLKANSKDTPSKLLA